MSSTATPSAERLAATDAALAVLEYMGDIRLFYSLDTNDPDFPDTSHYKAYQRLIPLSNNINWILNPDWQPIPPAT